MNTAAHRKAVIAISVARQRHRARAAADAGSHPLLCHQHHHDGVLHRHRQHLFTISSRCRGAQTFAQIQSLRSVRCAGGHTLQLQRDTQAWCVARTRPQPAAQHPSVNRRSQPRGQRSESGVRVGKPTVRGESSPAGAGAGQALAAGLAQMHSVSMPTIRGRSRASPRGRTPAARDT